ncbi:MAG: sugar-transfer associated ATP-grasp domain-containing protein [Gammaproteobacteria bacterium]
MSASKLGPSEYYSFGAYEKQFSKSDRREFVGWRQEDEIDRKLNSDQWRAVSNDKLLFHSTLQAGGIPFPPIKAFYNPRPRHFTGAKYLQTVEAMHDFLKDNDNLPIFIKPVFGSFGRGAVAVTKWLPETEQVVLASGDHVSLDDLLGKRTYNLDAGYLFQELVIPHKQTQALCGPRLSTVRVVVVLENDKPRIHSTVWKVLTGTNMSDNFDSGKLGNVLANINAETGRIESVIGIHNGLPVSSSTHPDTGVELIGAVLPCWQELRELCLSAASAYPGLKFQHWDVAISDAGPLALEANSQGSLNIGQLAARRGLMDSDFKAMVERLG